MLKRRELLNVQTFLAQPPIERRDKHVLFRFPPRKVRPESTSLQLAYDQSWFCAALDPL
jgi:hypothetical protein